jgi:hypothetical protein
MNPIHFHVATIDVAQEIRKIVKFIIISHHEIRSEWPVTSSTSHFNGRSGRRLPFG